MTRHLLNAVPCVCLAVLCCTDLAGSPVVLPNPGAETAADDNPGMPAAVGTYVTPGATAVFRRDTAVRRSGTASFHITNDGNPAEPDAGYNAVFMITVPVLRGLTYNVGAHVKTGEIREAGLSVRMRSQGGFAETGSVKESIGARRDWTRIAFNCTAPAGATEMVVFLAATDGGEAWFDDVTVSDNFEEVAGDIFPRLRAGLASLRQDAAEPGLPAPDLQRLQDALEEAGRLEEQVLELSAGTAVPFARKRSILAAHARLNDLVLSCNREMATRDAVDMTRRLTGEKAPAYVVGFAPSTVRVFLEDRPLAMDVAATGRILAVRGEDEAVQLVILPVAGDLTEVRVTVGDLRNDEAAVIPSGAVTIHPVGHVKVDYAASSVHPEEPVYSGWWPDPLLPNFAFKVDKGNSQPVWVSVRIPRGVPAGIYRGSIRIAPANAPEREVGLQVEVADFDLPEKWHFRNLLCWDDGYGPKIYGERWTQEFRNRFIEFQLDRRLNVGGLSGATQKLITVEDMIGYARRGQNVIFTYQFAWNNTMTNAAGQPVTQLPGKINTWMPRLKAAGCYDRALVYGWDERGPEHYPAMRTAAELLARDWPGVPMLMCGVDKSYGTDSILAGLPNIIFCPLMRDWDAAAAAKAKANGNTLWWYEIHWTIEQRLIRSRLIPWQSFKVGADGFLIWVINWWQTNDKPLAATEVCARDWNARGPIANSSGLYVYPGENGPISSLRLENFADGCEDYDLLAAARELLAELEERGDADSAVIDGLRGAVAIEDGFIKNALDYSTDPAVLTAHRQTLIRALAAAAQHGR